MGFLNKPMKIAIGVGGFVASLFSVHAIDKHHEKKAVIKAYEKGYSDASKIYERKLRKLTEAFLNDKKNIEDNLNEYKRLLADYEKYIIELENRRDDYSADVIYLKTKKKQLESIGKRKKLRR